MNYYIQYSYQGSKHVRDDKHMTLKVMTDGSLWNTISTNVLMKAKRKALDNKNNTVDVFTKYNIYDIIMVDEAHEHNKNMDLILTITKYSAYYNNSIKIVIISATMDDDEPTYRRFYRAINDNLKYLKI
jgi:HrpA-like RNA helicase